MGKKSKLSKKLDESMDQTIYRRRRICWGCSHWEPDVALPWGRNWRCSERIVKPLEPCSKYRDCGGVKGNESGACDTGIPVYPTPIVKEVGTVVTTVDAEEHILLQVLDLIEGDRAKEYGPIREDYNKTVALFKLLTGIELTAEQGVTFMVAVKLSRLARILKKEVPLHIDTLKDDIGYTAKLARMLQGIE